MTWAWARAQKELGFSIGMQLWLLIVRNSFPDWWDGKRQCTPTYWGLSSGFHVCVGACLCMCVCACICACTYTIPGPLDSLSSQTLTNGTVTFAISEVGGGWPGYWVMCWQRLTGIIKFLSEIKDVPCMVVHGFFLTTGRQSHNGFLWEPGQPDWHGETLFKTKQNPSLPIWTFSQF